MGSLVENASIAFGLPFIEQWPVLFVPRTELETYQMALERLIKKIRERRCDVEKKFDEIFFSGNGGHSIQSQPGFRLIGPVLWKS
jgi:hypothetical protein